MEGWEAFATAQPYRATDQGAVVSRPKTGTRHQAPVSVIPLVGGEP